MVCHLPLKGLLKGTYLIRTVAALLETKQVGASD